MSSANVLIMLPSLQPDQTASDLWGSDGLLPAPVNPVPYPATPSVIQNQGVLLVPSTPGGVTVSWTSNVLKPQHATEMVFSVQDPTCPANVSQPTGPNGAIKVTGSVDITFTFLCDQSTNVNVPFVIRPIGIVFKNTDPNQTNQQALANMPFTNVQFLSGSQAFQLPPNPGGQNAICYPAVTSGITIFDAFQGGVHSWKFYILFQWPDGTLSMIDPPIDNQPPNI